MRVISTEELQALVGCLSTTLSPLEADALRLYLEGSSYEQMAEELGCDTKTIDNALQRVKRKILTHQRTRRSCSSVRYRFDARDLVRAAQRNWSSPGCSGAASTRERARVTNGS